MKPSPFLSILMYHQVGHFDNPKIHRASFCDARRFARQMAWLHAFGYSVLSLSDALDCLFGEKEIPENAIVLTFDDGCDNFREYALPVLQKYHFPATMFLIADLLGKTTAQWMSDVPIESKLMTPETLRQLRKEGVSFGSHTLNHVHLAQCSPERQRVEIFDSKKKLEDVFGEKIEDFCYPFGDYNELSIALTKEAGYRCGLTCNRAAANYAPSPFELPRKAISYGDWFPGFWWKVHKKNEPKVKN